ncbi:MAG: CDGSH iron-sulfur domain-containing protein [Bacteroidia bacterium]|nr:CDGSH iron-sulfur domain-containing protein [Bacteroidia bacterium]
MTTRIKINSNGSIRVEGDFEIVDAEGQVFDVAGRTSVTLCRCGLSQKKPFCDSSHKGQFIHESKAFALPPPAPKPDK